MSEWNPVVVKLEKIERHPQADTLEMSTVLGGYTVIFKEGRFKEGDLAAYIPSDTICSDNVEFDWLGDKKRIKPIRLRGVFSLGILATAPDGMVEGDSVEEFYGLKKYVYEEEMEDEVPKDSEPAPKNIHVPYYDLNSIRQYSHLLNTDEEVVITEKLEGANFMAFHDGDRLWVKSRNNFKKEDISNQWWEVALRLNLKEKLSKYPNFLFYCELYGQVRGFKYDCQIVNNKIQTNIRFFDVYDSKSLKFLDWEKAEEIIKDVGLECVPVLYEGKWTSAKEGDKPYNSPLLDLANGQSSLGSNIKEGIVIRPKNERVNYRGQRTVLKFKSEAYCLKKG